VPGGKRSTTNTQSPKPSKYMQPSQLARVSVRGKCARNTPKTATATARPVADSSHPMGFPGRFQASSAPTVAKAPRNTMPTAPFNPLPPMSASLAGNVTVRTFPHHYGGLGYVMAGAALFDGDGVGG